MAQNILITGAAGYIGGSILANFVSDPSSAIKPASVIAAVRSDEQAQSLSKLGVKVAQVDLSDAAAVLKVVLDLKIDIVVHAASSMQPPLASNIIAALGKRRKEGGEKTYILHAAVTSMFSEEGGWPFGKVRDTDPIFEKEKQLPAGHPVRDTNILVTEESKAEGVQCFNIAIPYVWTGEWNKLSVAFPQFIRTSIKLKKAYKFDKNGIPPAAHISDLVDLFTLIVSKILQKEEMPTGEKGYYFAVAHKISMWEVMDRIAESLHALGLVESPKAEIWPSDEMAAQSLGWPLPYLESMGKSSGQIIPINPQRLGWQPKWDYARFLESVEDEVQAVQELDTVQVTVFDVLMKK